MRPGQLPRLQAAITRLQPARSAVCTACAVLAFAPLPVLAQDGSATGMPVAEEPREVDDPAPLPSAMPAPVGTMPGTDAAPAGEGEQQVAFEADALEYNTDSEVVTASGDVVLRQGDQSVRADQVTWDRETGQIVAVGDIRFVDEDGNQLFTDRLELTDELRAGAMSNFLLAFREGGRLAAIQATRADNGDVVVERAAYSGCAVEDGEGCTRTPSWRITAERVYFNAEARRIRFQGAYLELFGARVLPLPGLALQTDGSANSGFLIPGLGYTQSNGLEVSASYYTRLAPNRDLTASAYVFTGAKPMVSGQYRQLTQNGAYQITGYLTQGARIPFGSVATGEEEDDFRGYFFTNGRFQLDQHWRLNGSIRVASDRTFLRRYDISRDDRLRSTLEAERIDDNSYLSIAGWATQLLLVQGDQGLVPMALPAIDYRLNLADPVLGGRLQLQANSLAITRSEGQDTQRAFAKAEWSHRSITSWGQELTFTALARGDVYHTGDTLTTLTPSYRGQDGWHGRGIALGAVDLKWPLVGSFMGGTQVLTPRVQLVASPGIKNLAIPNEDSRAIELEDSNLFSLNRFPGYDRVEDGVRVTYGADYQLDLPGWRIAGNIGQSYRLSDKPSLFPDGTGLTDQFSDYVGRLDVRYRDFLRLTHRFRLDKDSLGVRRNEIDAAIGSDRTYVEVGYLRLNRNLDLTFEDLQDREELRAAGRVAFARYWSIFGSAVVNLTDRREDPTQSSDGFQPLRTRIGFAYADDCLEFGLTWRRDFVAIADSEEGSSFRVHFALRNINFR